MISHFFIHRPKFAFVISIVITLVGLLALLRLPVNQFPEITPPMITVSAVFSGASPEVVENTVLRPLEEKINGVENMLYMSSTASSDGVASVSIVFKPGTDADIAQVNVQNRVSQAEPSLPDIVKRIGVTVDKRSSTMLLAVSLYSPNNVYDGLYVNNYANRFILEPLARIGGVAKAETLGEQIYAMRMWLKPERMAGLSITVVDVQNAINEQNAVVAAGMLGATPTLPSQQFQYTVLTKGRLTEVEEFKNIVLRANPDGSIVYLKDVADVVLGSQSYSGDANLNGEPNAFIVTYQAPGANALSVAKDIKETMEELSKGFPVGIDYIISFDTTLFIEESLLEVRKTLFEAIFLVILVTFFFLQNWRMTLIPCIAIPVSLIGTLAVLLALGQSINTISLFGLVLAIGLVVDDAIIVVENVDRLLHLGLTPIEATEKSMKEITGPVIATTLVLLAVFAPVGFMPGITGGIYSQFAVTISVAVLISSINALTLSPALCAVLLTKESIRVMPIFAPVNKAIKFITTLYGKTVAAVLRRGFFVLILTLAFLASAGYMLLKTPTGFIPNEDQGFFVVDIQLPDAASANRTRDLVEEVTKIIKAEPGVKNVNTVAGYSIISGSSSNVAMAIISLDNWSERTTPELNLFAILQRLQRKLWSIDEAQILAFPFPAIPGLGSLGGFEFQLQNRAAHPLIDFSSVIQGLVVQANADPVLERVNTPFRANVPQYFLEVDRRKAKVQGVSLSEIFLALQAQLGSLYINDFTKYGRSYQVIIQADSKYRTKPTDLARFYVRNSKNEMVPLSSFASFKPVLGPNRLNHYNLYASASITGQPAAGYSSGDALKAMARLAEDLPQGYGYQWSGMSLQEIEVGNLAPLLYVLSLIFVYLFLVAQYESWTMPIAIIGAVPFAIFGAIGGVYFLGDMYHISNNIYVQVGMVLLIGVAAKTSILIVEFAMQLRAEGHSPFDSAKNAAILRFRAILMTAFSFILGVLPMVFATGAGASSRHSIGISVVFGMIATTMFSPIFVPAYYYLLQRSREFFMKEKPPITKKGSDISLDF